MRARSKGLWLSCALLACQRSVPSPSPPGPDASGRKPAADAGVPAPWTLTVMPFGRAMVNTTAVAGEDYYGIDSILRYHYRDGVAEVGEDIPARGFADFDVAESGATIFRTVDGAVYLAPSFTGSLRAVAGAPGGYRDVTIGSRYAFACSSDSVLARVPLEGEPVLEGTGQRCRRITARAHDLFSLDDDGQLHRSTDDGARFTRVDTAGLTLTSLGNGRLYASDGVHEIREDGTIVSTPGYERPPGTIDFYSGPGQAITSAIREAKDARFGPIDAASTSVRTAGGEYIHGRSTLDGTRIPGVLGAWCEFEFGGDDLVALCRAEHPLMTPGFAVYDREQGRWVRRARLGPNDDYDRSYADQPTTVVGSDGSVVIVSACEPAPEQDDDWDPYDTTEPYHVPLCWIRHDGVRSVTLEIPRSAGPSDEDEEDDDVYLYDEGPRVTLLGVIGARLVVHEQSIGSRVLDLHTGGPGEALSFEDHGKVVGSPKVEGGRLRALVQSREGPRLVELNGASLEARPLPDGVTSLGFASARRGLAVGEHAGRVWTTVDGGETWSAAAVELTGDPAAVALDPVRCTNVACRATPVLWADRALLDHLEYEPPKLVAPVQALSPRKPRHRR